jgi:hypothetical protein
MVSPEALKLNEILRNALKAVDMDLAHQREAGEHAEDMTSEPEGVRYEDAPEVEGLWATPQHWDGESAIVYLYGGGYVIPSPYPPKARRAPRQRLLSPHACSTLPSGARASLPHCSRGRRGRLSVATRVGRETRTYRPSGRLERGRPRGRHDAQAARARNDPANGRRPHLAVGGP